VSHGTRGSTRAHLIKEARSGAEGHVAVLELTSVRRRGLGSQDTWQHWSSPRQGGDVRSWGTCGSARAHLCREVWSESTAYMTARGCTHCPLSWLRASMRGTRSSWYRQYETTTLIHSWFLTSSIQSDFRLGSWPTDGVFQFHGAISIIINHHNIIFQIIAIFNEIDIQNFIFQWKIVYTTILL
jgi:hypothetical protein